MKTPEFMDKQISGHWSDDSSDYDDDDRYSTQFAFRSSLPRGRSDIRESAGSSSSLTEALIALVDQRMKEQTAVVLNTVEVISVRLAQLERRTRSMEGSIEGLKESLGNYRGITYGKLKELENLLSEVQSCTVDVRDKQDITLAQIHLTKLQLSKGKTEAPPLKTTTTETSSSQETTLSVSVPQQPYVSPHMSISHQQVYYQPPHQPFSGPTFLQHHLIPSVPPNTTSLSFSIRLPNDFSYPPPQNVSPSAANPPFQHFETSFPAFPYQSQPQDEHPPPSHPQLPYLQKEYNYDNLYHNPTAPPQLGYCLMHYQPHPLSIQRQAQATATTLKVMMLWKRW